MTSYYITSHYITSRNVTLQKSFGLIDDDSLSITDDLIVMKVMSSCPYDDGLYGPADGCSWLQTRHTDALLYPAIRLFTRRPPSTAR